MKSLCVTLCVMSKKTPEIKMVSFGIYTPFKPDAEALPDVLEFTTVVPAKVGVEFGYILRIRKARGEQLQFRIDHPPFRDESGQVAPPFEGSQYVRSNDYHFFLGDTLWEPVEDKVGTWTLRTWMGGELIGEKAFEVGAEAT